MRQVTGKAKTRRDPAPSRLSYRLERLKLSPLLRGIVRVGLPFALAFGAVTIYFSDDARRAAIITALTDLRQQIETRPEFMVRLVAVEGASPALEAQIRAHLPRDLPASSFDIDIASVQARIAALPAVARARVRLRRGGVMEVKVTERLAAAIWRNREGRVLVDREGVVIGAYRAGDGTGGQGGGLPHVAGAGANRDVPGALAILAAAAPLAGRLRGLVRVGERRWDVVLDRGQRILLPEREPVRALERVIVLDEVNGLLERDVAVVDMRLPERPTLRMNTAALERWRQLRRLNEEASAG